MNLGNNAPNLYTDSDYPPYSEQQTHPEENNIKQYHAAQDILKDNNLGDIFTNFGIRSKHFCDGLYFGNNLEKVFWELVVF